MGSIYRRGKVYWVKYYRNGKPYYESSHSDKVEVAKRILSKREGEISEGKLPGIYFDKVRFDELADDFLADYRINQKRSLKRAERSTGHLRKFFGGMRVTDITTPRINAYIENRLEEDAANATINRELAALKRMLNMGAKQTPPKVNLVPYIPMLAEHNIRKGFFEHGEFLALRDALPDYLKGFVTFAYKTGWRVSEIVNLTWDRVDLQNGIVRIEAGETKNREARTVYLDDELKVIFDQLWEARKKSGKLIPCVFPNRDGTDRIRVFRRAWVRACSDAGLGDRLFHDFRRTAVRNMVRAGIPERVAMMISGHKSRSVFERYNIVNSDDLRQAATRQEAYLENLDQQNHGYKMVTIKDFAKRKDSTMSAKSSELKPQAGAEGRN
jgi:integrase